MLDIFKFGFSFGLRQWKIAAIVYFFQLLLALTIGLQVMAVLESSIGNSLEINKLLQNYDHTVIIDFLKIHGASLSPLIGQLRWLILIYVFFAIFIDAGLLLAAANPQQSTPQTFWKGGSDYFFPFLKIYVFFLALVGVWTAIVFVPIISFLQPALEYFPNEKYIVWGILLAILIYLLGLAKLFLWSISSRFWHIQQESSFFTNIKKGILSYLKNFRAYWSLLALFFGLQVLLAAIYWTFSSTLGMSSAFLVIFMFLIQQVFSFFRLMIRQMLYIGLGKVASQMQHN